MNSDCLVIVLHYCAFTTFQMNQIFDEFSLVNQMTNIKKTRFNKKTNAF